MERKVQNVNMSNHHWKSAKYKHVQSTFLPSRSKLCKQSLLCEVGCTKKKFSERKSEMERKVQNVNMSNQLFSQSKKKKVQNLKLDAQRGSSVKASSVQNFLITRCWSTAKGLKEAFKFWLPASKNLSPTCCLSRVSENLFWVCSTARRTRKPLKCFLPNVV